MSQREVLEQIEKLKDWITCDELHKLIPFVSRSSVADSLKRLHKGGFIVCERDERVYHGLKYRVKKNE
jgi:predicted transcriptional regulator